MFRKAWSATRDTGHAIRQGQGEQAGADLLPRLHFVTTDPNAVPFAGLPQRFVVKPTHGSGRVEIVNDMGGINEAALARTCRCWLSQNRYEMTKKWICKDILPRILVGELVDDGNGVAPNGYKLFVFDRRVAFILVTMGRFDVRAHLLLDRDRNPVEVVMA